MQCFCKAVSQLSGRTLGFLSSDPSRTGNDIADEPVSFKSDLTRDFRNTNQSQPFNTTAMGVLIYFPPVSPFNVVLC